PVKCARRGGYMSWLDITYIFPFCEDITARPSPATATALVAISYWSLTATHRPSIKSQSRAVLSDEVVTMKRLLAVTATCCTTSEWPVNVWIHLPVSRSH